MGRPRINSQNKENIRKYKKSKEKKVPTRKTQKNKLEEPYWRTPHLNFGTPKPKFQPKLARKEVMEKEMPPKLKLREKMQQGEKCERLKKMINKILERMPKKEALKKSEDNFGERWPEREVPEK